MSIMETNDNGGAITPHFFEGKPVQIIMRDGNPWWVASEVCAALNLTNLHSSIALLEADEKDFHNVATLGGAQRMRIINESGLYSLVLRSRKQEAKRFKRWITNDVLPAIRKTGGYSVQQAPTTPALPTDYTSAVRALLSTLEEKDALTAKVKQDAPMVAFYKAVASSEDTVSMAEAAKMLGGMGRNKMMRALRQRGIFDAKNVPYQRFVDRKLFAVDMNQWKDGSGKVHIEKTPRAYARGVEFLRREFNVTATQPALLGEGAAQ